MLVVGNADQAHTRCGTALNLILQTGSATVAKIGFMALAGGDYFLLFAKDGSDRSGVGVRAEEAPFPTRTTSMQRKPGVLFVGRKT